MVVEAEFAAESFGALNQGQYRFGRGSNLCLLYVCLWIGQSLPNLRVDFVLLE